MVVILAFCFFVFRLCLRLGFSVDLSSGVATFAVDVFRNGTETDLSVGVRIDTEGRAAVNVTFNF